MIMKGVHNPITRAGFAQIKKILEMSMAQRKGENYADFVKLIGTVSYDNKDCWKVELSDPDYKIVNYTVAAGETTVWQIGKSTSLPIYHKMEDEKGIYEIYEFKELKLGVTLTDADFEFN